MRFTILLSCLLLPSTYALDVGYELMFTTNMDPIHRNCSKLNDFPMDSFANSSYLIQSVGAFDFEGYKFQMILDGFGKLYRFQFLKETNEICVSASMLKSEWYNESVKQGRVAESLIFKETIPPRPKCPMYDPFCNALAPNDNDYVLPLKIGDDFFLTTDNPIYLKYDPSTLSVQKMKFSNGDIEKGFTNMISMGAAHTVPRVNDTNAYIGVAMAEPDMMIGRGTLYLYEITGNDTKTRRVLNTIKLPKNYFPYVFVYTHYPIQHHTITHKHDRYVHAFGLTEHYAVLSLQPASMRLGMKSLMSGTLSNTIENYDESEMANSLTVVPLDGSAPTVFPMMSPQWSVHVVNTYENDTSVIFDYCSFPDMPFRDPLQLLSTRLNKTARDASQCRAQVKRAVLHLSGPRKGDSEILTLTELPRMVEFPMINFSDRGRSYCTFYGVEYWHDDGKTQSCIALRRTNICQDNVTYGYREDVYPSEPTFVQSKEKNQNGGYLVFVALHGEEKISKFHVIDAETFEDISETSLPTWIPFTAHGGFFSDV